MSEAHKLTIYGNQQRGMNAQCSCGEWFLATYVSPKRQRESLRQQHSQHLAYQRVGGTWGTFVDAS